MSKFALRAVGLAMAVVLGGMTAACGSSPTTPTSKSSGSGSQSAKTPYVIPAILSLTGGASFLGLKEKAGLEALEKAVNAQGGINGTPIHFQIYDNGTKPATAVSLASQILSKNPQIMINGSVVPVDMPVDNLVGSSGPVIYDMSPGVHPAAGTFVFSSSPSTGELMDAFLNYCRAKGWTKIAAITSTDASGQDGWNQLQAGLKLPENKGINLVDHESFDPTSVSVSSQLNRIAQAKPQALVAWSTGSPIEVVFKNLAQSPLANIPVYTTDGNEMYAQMKAWAAFLPPNLLFPGPRYLAVDTLTGSAKTVTDEFYSEFQNIGVQPDMGSALSWDPAYVLVSALKKTGLNASASTIRSTISSFSQFQGAFGQYDFTNSNRGLSVSDVYVSKWDASQQKWIPVSGAGGTTVVK